MSQIPTSTSFTKDCPQCRTLLAAEAMECACGHRFEAKAPTWPSSSLLVQAEELYESHLRARLQRAIRALRLAKVDLLRDPRNPSKMNHLRDAEKEAEVLETQLAVQSARVAAARTTPANRDESTGATPINTESPDAFRAAQAIKTEETSALRRLRVAAEGLGATGEFTTRQAEQAQQILQQTDQVRTCPNCGSAITLGVTRCQCGYALTDTTTKTAADFISAEEMAALRGGS